MALTEQQVEVVKARWAEGASMTQIGAELSVTRSVISGKLGRLKLFKSEQINARKRAANPEKPKTPKKTKPPKLFAWARKELAPILEVLEETESAVEFPTAGPGVIFAELDMQRHCRFPLGDPGTPGFRYCGAAREFVCLDDEIPHCYCAHHHAITHVPTAKLSVSARTKAA